MPSSCIFPLSRTRILSQFFIVESLCAYFSEGVDEKIDDDQLFHEFTNEKITETMVALPKYGPWFSQTGVEFVYQQYEITAYAFGMPEFTLPYEKVKGFLTPAAADLVK